MLKYLLYVFVALVSYSILAYVYAGPSRGAPPVSGKSAKETFFVDENSAELIKELSTMATRLAAISSKLGAKPRTDSPNDGHEESKDTKKEKEKEKAKEKEPFKEEASEKKETENKASDGHDDERDDESSKKSSKKEADAEGSKKKNEREKEKEKDDDAAMIDSMKSVMQQPPSPPKAEGFANYDGVESVKFSNYMLL